VGVDGSAPAAHAVRFAISMAADAKPARIYLCGVLLPVEEMAIHDSSDPPVHAFDDAFLERAREETRLGGVDAVTQLLHGDPADELVREAAFVGADLLVLGTRPSGPMHELAPNSLILRVLDHAPCPVVLAR
jgi:nucleotide-binding universal stress UspA family protein